MPAHDSCGVGSLAWTRMFLSVVWGLKEVLILRGVNTRLIASETFRTYRGWLHRLLVGPVLVLGWNVYGHSTSR